MSQEQDKTQLVGRERKFEPYLPGLCNELTPVARMIYTWLTLLGDGVDCMRYPGHVQFAGLLGLDRHTVGRAFDRLVAHGLLTYNGRKSKGMTIRIIRDKDDTSACVKHMRNVMRTMAIPPRASVAKQASEKPTAATTLAEEPTQGTQPANAAAAKVELAKPQAARSPNRKTRKGQAMDQATVRAITRDHDSMTLFILFGQKAVLDRAAERTPTQMNWRTIKGFSKDNMRFDEWTTHQLAGYYWWIVSWYRNENGIDLTIPDWDRLLKDIAALQAEMANDKVFDYMRFIVGEYPNIMDRMAKLAFKPQLDDTAMSNRLLRQAYLDHQHQPVEAV